MKKYIFIPLLALIILTGWSFGIWQKNNVQKNTQSNTQIVEKQEEKKQKAPTSSKSEKIKKKSLDIEKAEKLVKKEDEAKKVSEEAPLSTVDFSKAPKDLIREDLLVALQETGKKEQYEKFAEYLAEVYVRYPQGDKEFVKIESETYVRASDYLDKEKNAQKALDTADTVFKKVPFGWRFKYLKVRAMESLGRTAFTKGDLAKAEDYAKNMLRIEYRPEGANLLADVFIKKIETALKQEDISGAREYYEEIKDYEVSPDRKTQLDALAVKLQKK